MRGVEIERSRERGVKRPPYPWVRTLTPYRIDERPMQGSYRESVLVFALLGLVLGQTWAVLPVDEQFLHFLLFFNEISLDL